MHSEFPFSKRPTKNFKYEQSNTTFPEVIEEDKAEAENQVSETHQFKISSVQATYD